MHTSSTFTQKSRQQRRAERRALKKGQMLRKPLCLSTQQIGAISDLAARAVDQVLQKEWNISPSLKDSQVRIWIDRHEGSEVSSPAFAKGGLMAFAAKRILQNTGIACRVAAGRAIWSVGKGDEDTIDHGVTSTGSINTDVAAGFWHTWIEVDGWLLDFASRLLQEKFETASETQPFSTPKHLWAKFPDVIVHDPRFAMPNPLNNRNDRYGYWEEQPRMLKLVEHACVQQHQEICVLIDNAFEAGFRI